MNLEQLQTVARSLEEKFSENVPFVFLIAILIYIAEQVTHD